MASEAADIAAREYAELLERVPAVLYVADTGPEGRWYLVSPQIETILGFTPEEWCADPTLWASRLHPEDRDRMLASESERLELGRTDAAEYRMIRRDGEVIWIRDDAQLVSDESGQIRWHGFLADVTDRKRAEAELERRALQQAAVARLGEHALEHAEISELMEEAVAAAAQIIGAPIGIVGELVRGGGSFITRAAFGLPGGQPHPTAPAGTRSQAGYTLLQGAPVIVTDWEREIRFQQSPWLAKAGVRSGVSVTIEGRNGPFGVLGIHSPQPREYSTGDVDFIQSLANVLADALERQATEDDISHRALHDALTGLPNRVLFLDRLEQALARLRRRNALAAVLFLDIDRFKLVNDSLGHQAGDELLAVIAPRLKQAVRPSDTVARFGGDEFGILLEEIPSERDAIATAERIAAVFARPVVLAGNEHFVTTSVGIALAQGGEQADALIRDADAAMYRAKERGRARYELFDEVMRARAIDRLRVENDLRRALEREELLLHYQPVVGLSSGSIVGVEALLRWEHPERGLVLPDEFIPVAEENGMIRELGRWVVEHACTQAARWYEARPDAAPLVISINLSPVELAHSDLPATVAAALRTTGLDPACLSLEITEGVLLEGDDDVTEILHSLKAIGVEIVLDDFGTGYSSLAYLTRLPIDTLKVGRRFIEGLGTDGTGSAVTEAIISMARALSIEVVAEGVETAAQVAELRRLGCELAQGYYFSKPAPAETISELMRERPPWAADTAAG